MEIPDCECLYGVFELVSKVEGCELEQRIAYDKQEPAVKEKKTLAFVVYSCYKVSCWSDRTIHLRALQSRPNGKPTTAGDPSPDLPTATGFFQFCEASHAGEKVSHFQRTDSQRDTRPGHRPWACAYTGRAGADGRDFSGGGEEIFHTASVGGESGGAGTGSDWAGTIDPK